MFLSFFGAAGEVTGSCNLLETKDYKILIDCGMFQGSEFSDKKNHQELSFNPQELSAVIVTHAHLDHVGRLPLLIRGGYQGPIYATQPTIELAKLILEDALQVMEENYLRFGSPVLYDMIEVAKTLQQFKAVEYGEEVSQHNGSFTFHDAGHIFGSAFVEINIEGKKIVFSGDIGNEDMPIVKDSEVLPEDVDVLVCESTYGGHIHEANTFEQREKIIKKIITESLKHKGAILIPSFALERTQELLYILNDLVDRQHILPNVPIFLDSPLAIRATRVYRKYPRYYDKQATEWFKEDKDLFSFPGLTYCENKEESKKINHVPCPKIIIAGAGMMNGGRILHHALRHLTDPESTLLFIGYQATGTLGRKILNGQSPVNILGEHIPVKCNIKAIGALSAHADQNRLLSWVGSADGKKGPQKIFLNHGEPKEAMALSALLKENLGAKVVLAEMGKKIKI